MKKLATIALLSLATLAYSAPKVILKLDDLQIKKGVVTSSPTLNYLMSRNIKAALGVIANRIDTTRIEQLTPYLKATNQKGESYFEIWNHGYDHVRPEFGETSTYEYQKEHFEKADKYIKKHLGIQMTTFGSPYNQSDDNTDRVIWENSNYNVVMFSKTKPKKENVKYLYNRVDMEIQTGVPSYDFFTVNFQKTENKYQEYIILQGHPNMWKQENIEEFGRILDFLIEKGCEFILPNQLAPTSGK